MGGKLAQRASIRAGGALSITGIVVLGDRRSRSVVKDESCAGCCPPTLPP